MYFLKQLEIVQSHMMNIVYMVNHSNVQKTLVYSQSNN